MSLPAALAVLLASSALAAAPGGHRAADGSRDNQPGLSLGERPLSQMLLEATVKEVGHGTLLVTDSSGVEREIAIPEGTPITRDGAPSKWREIEPGDVVSAAPADKTGRLLNIDLVPGGHPRHGKEKGKRPKAAKGGVSIKGAKVKTVVAGGKSLILEKAGTEIEGDLDKRTRYYDASGQIEWWRVDEGDAVEEAVMDAKKTRFLTVTLRGTKPAIEK